MQSSTLTLMKEHSQLFMGVQPEVYVIVEHLAAEVGGDDAVFRVMLTLRRLRLNEVYALLSLYMGISVSHASSVFRDTLPTLAACMNELIFSVPKGVALRNLPVAFRLNYHEVTHTLDCFEVGIETPSNAKHRAITYSKYKGGPTLKYLVSITPDCFCNYVSRGYGGRNTDTGITNDCGILDEFESGSSVLADRGFKWLESSLDTMGVKLQRPPSVYELQPLSKSECDSGRQIASVRIHVERYIGRLREYQLIAPHANVPVKMIPLVDCCVIVACGLTNLGAPLIRANEIGL